ncbi:MAG: M12 family metallopeptidase [bacterium]|nr:M12 family metallopeptidase [bacterium]
MRFKVCLSLGVLLSVSVPTITTAHDLHGLVAERSSLDPETRAKFDEVRELRRLLAARSAATRDPSLEAVVQTTLKWTSGLVTVCFFDGIKEARDHVADVAARWTASTSLKFDFGPQGNRRTCNATAPSDIRVSFVGSGYWSYVGTQSRLIDPNKQTLNLQGMDRASFTEKDDGVILHEFGHAVGFEHEHQSPVGGCNSQFNWNYLYTALGWSKAEVDRNMRQLDVSSTANGLLTTAFDRKSIMLYSLSPAAFLNAASASCYIAEANNTLSAVDSQAMKTVYPSIAAGGAPAPAGAMPAPPTAPDAIAAAQQMRRLQDLVGGR